MVIGVRSDDAGELVIYARAALCCLEAKARASGVGAWRREVGPRLSFPCRIMLITAVGYGWRAVVRFPDAATSRIRHDRGSIVGITSL